MDDITNTNVAPYISVTGSVTNVCQSDHSFDMSPSQYIALPRCSSPFPIHGHFIESKRWGEGKSPKMFVGSTVAFGGFVDRIKRERDKDYTVCAVNVEVVNLAFITTSSTSQFLQNRKTSPSLLHSLIPPLYSFSRAVNSFINLSFPMELSKSNRRKTNQCPSSHKQHPFSCNKCPSP
jgi:hypothetical protein